MSGFSAEWLALREPADVAARSADLAAFVSRRFEGRLVDLGGGTGANIRYLAAKLPSPQHWTLVDDDPALMARVPPFVTRHRADLTDVVDDGELFDGCSLVTASALLDLVSDTWLAKLVLRCRAAGARTAALLSATGYVVKQETSDWKLLPSARELQRELVNGWAAAAAGIVPPRKSAIENWRVRRIGHIDAGRSRIVVGHVDVAGILRA